MTTVAVFVGLVLFLQRTTLGLAMCAASPDFEMVRLTGIRSDRVFTLAFLISGLLVGLACIFIMARIGWPAFWF